MKGKLCDGDKKQFVMCIFLFLWGIVCIVAGMQKWDAYPLIPIGIGMCLMFILYVIPHEYIDKKVK